MFVQNGSRFCCPVLYEGESQCVHSVLPSARQRTRRTHPEATRRCDLRCCMPSNRMRNRTRRCRSPVRGPGRPGTASHCSLLLESKKTYGTHRSPGLHLGYIGHTCDIDGHTLGEAPRSACGSGVVCCRAAPVCTYPARVAQPAHHAMVAIAGPRYEYGDN